jgi:hypothetical protein
LPCIFIRKLIAEVPPKCMSPMSAATMKRVMTSRVKKELDPMVVTMRPPAAAECQRTIRSQRDRAVIDKSRVRGQYIL